MDRRSFVQLVVSLFILSFSVVLSLVIPQPQKLVVVIIITVLAQISSSIFFPIIVGYYQEKEKRRHENEIIWDIFQDFSEGGIVKVYKDRERSNRLDNGETSLKKAFEEHKNGTIKMVGVSLRVFFNQTGQFYDSMINVCELQKYNKNIEILCLISNENAPETKNRANIESPNASIPSIVLDIQAVQVFIEDIKRRYNNDVIKLKKYMQAPYCTAIIFPDKCFFSPNLLCDRAPVRLPFIIFKKGFHGYEVINSYFDYLWSQEYVDRDKEPVEKSK